MPDISAVSERLRNALQLLEDVLAELDDEQSVTKE